MTNFITLEVKDDPLYVKWYAEYVLQTDGEYTYEEIPIHKCSEKELQKFHKPAKTSN